MKDSTDIEIRRAEPAEASVLFELSLRSKAHWGYDAAFMQAARDELDLTSTLLARAAAFVAVRDAALVGLYVLDVEEGEPRLSHLWVEPRIIGTGVGSARYRHMLTEAKRLAYRTVHLASDPNAAESYVRMGARRVGAVVSRAIAGRELPLFEADVPA